MHLACPPKFCISIVFNFSWNGCNTKEKWKPTVAKFFLKGGGQTRCIMGYEQMANITLLSISRSFRPFYADNPDNYRNFRRLPKIPEDFRRLPKMSEEPSKHLTVFSLETLSPTQTLKTQLTNLRNTKKQQEAIPARTDCCSSESCLNK